MDQRNTNVKLSAHSVFSCSTCDNFALSRRSLIHELHCCGQPLSEISNPDIETTTPTTESVSKEVFGLPKNGIEIYQRTSELGVTTVSEIATSIGNDRSVATRYLNQLADIGMLEKSTRIRRSGGEINVYYPISKQEINKRSLLSLYMWAATAADALDDATRMQTNYDTDGEQSSKKLSAVFW